MDIASKRDEKYAEAMRARGFNPDHPVYSQEAFSKARAEQSLNSQDVRVFLRRDDRIYVPVIIEKMGHISSEVTCGDDFPDYYLEGRVVAPNSEVNDQARVRMFVSLDKPDEFGEDNKMEWQYTDLPEHLQSSM